MLIIKYLLENKEQGKYLRQFMGQFKNYQPNEGNTNPKITHLLVNLDYLLAHIGEVKNKTKNARPNFFPKNRVNASELIEEIKNRISSLQGEKEQITANPKIGN